MASNSINTLLEEFDKEFTREDGLIDKYSWYGQPEESIGPNSTPDAIKLFIRTAFTKYNSELAAKIKTDIPNYYGNPRNEKMVYLSDLEALLKEENV